MSSTSAYKQSKLNDPPLPDLPLIDFDGHEIHQVTVDEGEAIAMNGALKLSAKVGERVKVRLTPRAEPWNLVDYVNVAIDFENVMEKRAWIRILIKDNKTESESWYRPNCSHNAWVEPGETRIFPAILAKHKGKPDNNPGYYDRFPGIMGLPHCQNLCWSGINAGKITELILQLEPLDFEQCIIVRNVRGNRRAKPITLDTDPDAFFPFLDDYGQYMHEDWPGKISSDADLLAAKTEEDKDLATNPWPAQYNAYGGWATGPSLHASGHFRTEKINGKWWFVDPVGNLFWSLGSTDIGLNPKTVNIGGKQRLFYGDLPDRDDPVYGSYYLSEAPGVGLIRNTGDFFNSNYPILRKKYGSEFMETYNARSLERIRSWGLNTLGLWSAATNQQPDSLKTPYVSWIDPSLTNELPVLKPVKKLYDPFDANFAKVHTQAFHQTNTADDPWCIGLFVANEIHWGSNPEMVVREIMETCDGTQAAKVELVKNLQEEYATISAANDMWGASFASFDELLPALGKGNFGFAGAAASMENFYVHLATTYYRKTAEALKSAAPNKLNLGSRIYGSSMNKELISACAAYADVVSFNIYHKDLFEFQGPASRDVPFFPEDKPYMIGEFTFGALDRGNFWTCIEHAADQRNRTEAYTHFINSGLDDTRCIGAHWFGYADGPNGGRHKDTENAAKGLIDVADTPHYELINGIRDVGRNMYSRRYGPAGSSCVLL